MAAFSEDTLLWQKQLNYQPIFDELRENRRSAHPRLNPEGLMVVHEGQLFAWDNDKSRLLTMNLKEMINEVHDETNKLQKLLCTNTPKFYVEHILVSMTGSCVLLWGTKGAAVLTLPRRYGQYAQFEGGKEQMNCRTTVLAERFFMSCVTVHLLQAAWYPGSDTDTHIALLTSDNTLRLYDATMPQKPIQCHRLGEYTTSYSLSATQSTFELALGDVAVAFDFGPQSSQEPAQPFGVPSNAPRPALIPIYILKGNGDVFLLNTSLSEPRISSTTNIQGPLTMYPPAEDNYGLDACSIMCLPTSPTVLVVATSAGILHHCIVLSGSGDDEEEEDGDNDGPHSTVSGSMSDVSNLQGKAESSLYVYESVELSLTPVSSDEEYTDDISYPILLHKDPSSPFQYYCSHSAGVHCTTLAWLQKLQTFCWTEPEVAEDGAGIMDQINQDEPCTVKHMICTKPLESCPPAPILGLAIVADQLLGQALLCRTVTNDCIVTPLGSSELSPVPGLVSEGQTEVTLSPLRRLSTEPFQNHIRKILRRDVSNPMLKGSSRTNLSPKECFELIHNATKVLRKEYIHKQDLARDEIEKHVRILKQQKEQQKADLQDSARLKKHVHDRAGEIAEKYSDVQEMQEKLMKRVTTVLHALHGQLPVLTEAEHNMQRDMIAMQTNVEQLQNNLTQVQKKSNYQKKKIEELVKVAGTSALSETQNKQLRTFLQEENDSIAVLIRDLKNLQVAVGH